MSTLLAISSSPRRNGNSELLLQSFTGGAEDSGLTTELVRINQLNFLCCQACDRCATDGTCILDDDMKGVYEKVASARGMVIATPIYFGTVNAQLKMFIDRFQSWWHAKYNLQQSPVDKEEGRPGFLICVGAMKKEAYCENAESVVRILYHNLNYTYMGSLCYREVDTKGAIRERQGALDEAYEAGRKFAGYTG